MNSAIASADVSLIVRLGGRPGADPPAPIPVTRPSGRAPYRVDILPLPTASGFHRNEASATVLVLIHDPARRSQLGRYELSLLYRLTPAEAALAEAVAAGETLRGSSAIEGDSHERRDDAVSCSGDRASRCPVCNGILQRCQRFSI